MTTKKFIGVFLSISMSLPSGATASTTGGTIKGTVSMAGRGLSGLSLTVVNVETGRSYAVQSSADGSFSALVPAGSYVFASPGRAGVSIARAPLSIDVASGKVASANIEVASLSAHDAAAKPGTTTITHSAANCITEGEFTLIEATFDPVASVVKSNLFFKSNLSDEWFYTQFERIEPAVAGGPTHRAFIPKVTQGGGIVTIDYYISVTGSDFLETKSPENQVKVVTGATDCSGTLAPIGSPNGAVSVLSASGNAAGSLAGFGGIAGGAAGIAGIVGIVGGVALGGGALVAVTNNSSPTPTPTQTTPTPTPPPTPPPTATPVQQCSILVVTTPNASGGDWGPAGTTSPANTPGLQDGLVLFSSLPRYCSVAVTSGGTPVPGSPVSGTGNLSVACSQQISFTASVAPPTSKIGPLPATWGGDCGGSALGNPCQFGQITTPKTVTLTCQTR